MCDNQRMIRCVLAGMIVASSACSDAGSLRPPVDVPRTDPPARNEPLTIRIVDETGSAVGANRVLVQDQPSDPFWLAARPATCVDGSTPCGTWVVDVPFANRIAVAADRTTNAVATAECQPYASTFATVHPGTVDVPSQIVHLTLPNTGTYCVDPATFRSTVNVDHDDETDPSIDVLAPPAPPTGIAHVTLTVVDAAGEPVPATIAHWYYPPDSGDYDGEHPMTCANQRCDTWVLDGNAPRAGLIYLNASYSGPLNPFLQQGWSGYNGAPYTVEIDAGGNMIPIVTTLAVDTDLEAATGG
jgi:hypothetical protein